MILKTAVDRFEENKVTEYHETNRFIRVHPKGDAATGRIARPAACLAALQLLAIELAMPRRCALPAKPLDALYTPSNCRF